MTFSGPMKRIGRVEPLGDGTYKMSFEAPPPPILADFSPTPMPEELRRRLQADLMRRAPSGRITVMEPTPRIRRYTPTLADFLRYPGT